MEFSTAGWAVTCFWLVKSDYGWLIERQEWPDAMQVLAKIFFSFPVLCDTPAAAARLAEAVHGGLSHHADIWPTIGETHE
jgi:hypothetical protein